MRKLSAVPAFFDTDSLPGLPPPARLALAQTPAARARAELTATGPLRALYSELVQPAPSAAAREAAQAFLQAQLERTASEPCDLPESPGDLHAWMHAQAHAVAARYREYLQERRDGASRRYFSNRAHALFFLRAAAPTKLVDGSWLYGVLWHAHHPLLQPLVRTYLEELGDGEPDKNHVLLYRNLLASHGLAQDLPREDALYEQGLVQLALGWSAQDFLPEAIGFNLGYEQLPLHLLITAYELNELGLDPYYFTLHVTVDNASTGHAHQACDAVLQMLAHQQDASQFWQRVRAGSRLANAGVGTTALIEGFDIAQEATRIFRDKAPAGAGLHSDYARIAGRTVNDWLAEPDRMPDFLQALADGGWIVHGQPAAASRLWRLLQGERAEMFGVFSAYELQVIHDWIRGADSSDGQAYFEPSAANQTRRRPTFRALQRARRHTSAGGCPALCDPADPDLAALQQRLASLDGGARLAALIDAMSPAGHWTPTGLHATRQFVASVAPAHG